MTFQRVYVREHLPLGAQALIAILPVVFGGTFPVFGLTNLVWGSLYGFLGVWFHEARIPHPLWTDAIWILGGPALVIYLTGKLASVVWGFPSPIRALIAAAYLATLSVLVPVEPILTAPWGQPFAYEAWPLYVKLLVY